MKQDFIYNILAIVVCITCMCLQYKTNKTRIKRVRPVQVQNVVWLVGFLIYLLNVVPYYPIDGTVYFAAMAYLVAYNLVFLISPIEETQGQSGEIEFNSDRQRKKVITASILCWIVSIPILKKTIPILLMYGPSQGMNALRYRTYGEYSIFSTPELMLVDYIIRPVMVATILLMAEEISNKKFKYQLIIVSILDALWLVLATAGRSLFVTIILYVFWAVVIKNGFNIKKVLSGYKRYIVPCSVLLIFIVQIISKRINRDNGLIIEGTIYYFSGLPYLSALIKNGTSQSWTLFGKATFSSIIDIPIVFLRTLGVIGHDFLTGQQTMSGQAKDFLFVGDEIQTNATASTLFPFYLDFGIVGTFLGGLLLGCFAHYVERNYTNKRDCLSLGQYIFMLSFSMTTIQNYPLTGIPFIMKWIFIYLLLK